MCFYNTKLKRVRPFENLFKSNKEELEILNSFQNFIFISKVPPHEGAARGPGTPLATPLIVGLVQKLTRFKFH